VSCSQSQCVHSCLVDRRPRVCKTPFFWVDALCINQDCVTERIHQVQMMNSIYSTASLVLIWLGQHADGSRLVTLGVRSNMVLLKCKARRGLRRLLSRPYWTRFWVVQKLIFTRPNYLMCGQDLLPWDGLRYYMDKLRRWAFELPPETRDGIY
jgi:hypothetical protein